jgi:hypothetical protein
VVDDVQGYCYAQQFCDIFPCGDSYDALHKIKTSSSQTKALNESAKLKLSSFTQRDKDVSFIKAKNDNDRGLSAAYEEETLDRLYSRCSKLILDCVDWTDSRLSFANVTHAYDIIHELYCAQLSQSKGGLPISQVKALRKYVEGGR